jgi:hypothetical protein
MAHFAKLDNNNQVIEVHVVSNSVLDPHNEEESGIAFFIEWSNGYTNWKQTSYNGTIRYNYAGIGYTYFSDADAFVAPNPECGHPELTLNQTNYKWECDNAEHELILE